MQREETGILAFKNLHSLQKLEGAPRVRHVLGLLRKYIPKYFFKAVNRQLSFNQGQQIMQHFRSEVDGDHIVEAQPFIEYFADLYTRPQMALRRIHRTQSSAEVIITEGELEVARTKLSKHKAVGVDRLADMRFHNEVLWDRIKDKVLFKFNEWALTLKIPQYLKLARIIPLSKEANSAFPAHGQVRTIAVTPAITKLYELCILGKLREEIQEKDLIHERQRGFVPSKSCDDNLMDLAEIVQKAKDLERGARQARVPNWRRCKTFILFIDLKKAFDMVQRPLLLQKLRTMQVSEPLVQTLHSILQGTAAEIDGRRVNMDIGVP